MVTLKPILAEMLLNRYTMEGVIKIWNDEGEVHELSLTKKDIKLLKNIVMDLEKVYIRSGLQGQKLKEPT